MVLSRQSVRKIRFYLIAVGILGLALPIAWNNGIGEQILPKRWVEIEPGFFRSGQLHPRLIERVLGENEIRVIVDLTSPDPLDPAQRAEQVAARKLGIAHHRFPLDGSGVGELRRYADAIEVIDEARRAGSPVLVHCAAGARRAAGVVATYQVLVEGRRAEDVYAELDRYGARPVAQSPLLPYLNQNMGALARLLVERDVIEHVPGPPPEFVPPS
jgi:protein tyrosine phosphatase (PTP) superfamily phosphohydrolase (DUF442 family)